MKRAISITIIIAVCLIVALSLPVSAAKTNESGPAEKATGCVSSGNTVLTDWYIEFNAHEGIGDRPARGIMRQWNDTMDRELRFIVKYVDVEGGEAWFAGECIYDNTGDPSKCKVGHWVFVKVGDGGEPGVGADCIGWNWPQVADQEAEAARRVNEHETPDPWYCPIDEGNLQVHTR